jgi:DNA polymerase III subunit gamma/tau
MSYQVLARKWRPKSFTELVGQEHVVTVLVNALTQQRLHHAYLFTGTRGVGKTTIARIFAKSLNCEQGITAQPCGICQACVDIDAGKFVDLLEIDAASRTKVDDTREILDNVQYAPTRGRYKVYLIDEVHMLSRSSFNALLKTLEEPPEHVKFILATTDPQKLPVTVLSRCLQFHLKALSVKQISDKVTEILSKEAVTFDDEAISLLAKAARGSMRDCLSLTDQSIAQGNGNISRDNVQQMLGGVDRDWVFKILIALLKQDATALMKLSLAIASYAPSYSRLSAELIQLLHQVAMAQVVETNFSLPTEHQQMLTQFCQLMSPEDVQLYYQIVLTARKDLPYADDEQAAFDMMLLRLLAFKPLANNQSLPESTNEVVDVDTGLDKLPAAELSYATPNVTKAISADDLVFSSPATAPITEAMKATVSHNDASNNGVNSDVEQRSNHQNQVENELSSCLDTENNSALANEMLAIERQADAMIEPVPHDPLLSAHTSEQHSEPPQLASQDSAKHNQASDNNYNQDALSANTNDTLGTENTVVDGLLTEPQDSQNLSPVAAAIATRNMLRSRKKALEKSGKKSSDAIKRPSAEILEDYIEQTVPTEPEPDSGLDLSTVPEQPYSEEFIDPATIKLANQVDKWAHMIDSMSLAARLRQLAIHATIDENSTDDLLILQLDQSIKHLNSDAAHKQLERKISEYLQRKVTVELNIVERTVADPYQIQADINAKRYEYAKQVLAEDEIVIALQQQFQAELDQETIVAR